MFLQQLVTQAIKNMMEKVIDDFLQAIGRALLKFKGNLKSICTVKTNCH